MVYEDKWLQLKLFIACSNKIAMKKGIICLMFFICLASEFISTKLVCAQEEEVEGVGFRVITSFNAMDIFTCPEGSAQLINPEGNPVGCEKWGTEANRVIDLITGSRFEVKPFYGTLVSSDAHSVLKYGHYILHGSIKMEMELALYSGTGEMLASNKNHHGNSAIAMSRDGFFAVAGPRIDRENLEECYLTLYTPTGQEMFTKRLEGGLCATKINLSEGARAIVLSVTTSERDIKGSSDVIVFNNSGSLVSTFANFTHVNSLLFVGDDQEYLLVFSIHDLTLVNANEGLIIWQTPQFYRLVGPYSLGLSVDRKHLCILTAELTESKENIYIWRANLVSMKDGSLLGSIDLSGRYPISRVKTVDWVSESSFRVKTRHGDIFLIDFE